ncbi:hypothetical protein PEC18_00075 [Paucibacter sp. O1-1]|nr:hypothetical protein [Paucibacter sp. O1-1]MDA3824326.1 hypothetical protein [Paucibacter sp. O1-1]
MSHNNRYSRALLLSGLVCMLSIPAMAKQGDLKQELKNLSVSQSADIKNNQIISNAIR